jgi:hypothetical protein
MIKRTSYLEFALVMGNLEGNDFVFNKIFPSFIQVIFLVIHWIHTWSFIQQPQDYQDMDIGCT